MCRARSLGPPVWGPHSLGLPSFLRTKKWLVGRAKQLSSLIKTLDLFWGGHSCCEKHLLKEAMEQLSSSVPLGAVKLGGRTAGSHKCV